MGTFLTVDGVVPALDQVVTVNGSASGALWCSGIRLGVGLGASSADFEAPEHLFDTYRGSWKDALVAVYVDGSGRGAAASGTPAFLGYLDTESATVTPQSDGVRMTAASCGAYLGKVWVGQGLLSPVVEFALEDPVSGRSLGWTGEKMLKWLWDYLPANYKSRFALGRMDVMREAASSKRAKVTFRNCTYADAVQQLADLQGDVVVYERFEGGVCYLDFARVGEATGGSVATLAEWSSVGGANIATLSHVQTGRDVVNRVIGYGGKARYMVSVKSAVTGHSETETTAEMALIGDWNTAYEAAVLADPKTARDGSRGFKVLALVAADADATTLGLAVPCDLPVTEFGEGGAIVTLGAVLELEGTGEQMLVTGYVAPADRMAPRTDPDWLEKVSATVTVQREYNGILGTEITAGDTAVWLMPGVEHVFRRYKLPACFSGVEKMRTNVLRRSVRYDEATGERVVEWMKPQAWIYATRRRDWVGEDLLLWSDWNDVPTQVKADFDLEKGEAVFAKPTVVERTVQFSAGADAPPVTTYVRTVCGLVVTYASPGCINYDTGRDSGSDSGIPLGSDGLTEQWQREDLQYAQLTNIGRPLTGASGADLVFPCLYVDEASGEALVATGATAVVDDTPALVAMCRQALKAKRRRLHTFTVGIPWLDRGYELGDRLVIAGAPMDEVGALTVTQVTHEMPVTGEHRTTVVADNRRPPRRVELGSRYKGGRGVRARRGHQEATGLGGGQGWSVVDPTPRSWSPQVVSDQQAEADRLTRGGAGWRADTAKAGTVGDTTDYGMEAQSGLRAAEESEAMPTASERALGVPRERYGKDGVEMADPRSVADQGVEIDRMQNGGAGWTPGDARARARLQRGAKQNALSDRIHESRAAADLVPNTIHSLLNMNYPDSQRDIHDDFIPQANTGDQAANFEEKVRQSGMADAENVLQGRRTARPMPTEDPEAGI